MKRLVLILALIGATLGVNAATASAANCTMGGSTAYAPAPDHNLEGLVVGYNCTDVDKIRFIFQHSGWNDVSLGGAFFQQTRFYGQPLGVNHEVTVTCCGVPGWGSYANSWMTRWCWWSGGNHTIQMYYSFQFHRQATQTWGTATPFNGGPVSFAC
jgi:hypothetical protein